MQTKLIEILSAAKDWMTAADIATKGGWRSPANVGVALQQMEKANGNVERRKSPTKKQGNGMPATEWKLTENAFAGDVASTKSTSISTKLVETEPACVQQTAKSYTQNPLTLTGKTQAKMPAPVFTQPAHDNEMADLRAKLALAEKQRNAHFSEAELAQKKIVDLEDDVRRQVARADENQRMFRESMRELSEAIGLPDDGFASTGRTLETIKTLRQEMVRLSAENAALKTLNTDMPGFGAMHQAISAGPFVVRTPSKPPRFTSKHKNAHAVAMSAARRHGFAEVFALVPVGKAVRGAEWRPK